MIINTNPLTGSWVVREIQITDGVITRVSYDAFLSQHDAIDDAQERQTKLIHKGNMFIGSGKDGNEFRNNEFPDVIIIGVTMRKMEGLI